MNPSDQVIENASPAADTAEISRLSTKQRWVAAVLSAFLPGVGQVMIGDVRSGVLTLAAFAAIVLLWWPARLPEHCTGAPLLLLVMMMLAVYACWKALSKPLS